MSNHISSSGERAAIVGYSAQYFIAAEQIYAALLAGQLEWIALADPAAGRVDDIQVATPGKIDAYQIKWGEQVGSISFNDLTTGEGDPGDSREEVETGQITNKNFRPKTTEIAGYSPLCNFFEFRTVLA